MVTKRMKQGMYLFPFFKQESCVFRLPPPTVTHTEVIPILPKMALQLADKRLRPLVFLPKSLSEAWSCAVELAWQTFPGRADAPPFGPCRRPHPRHAVSPRTPTCCVPVREISQLSLQLLVPHKNTIIHPCLEQLGFFTSAHTESKK